MAPVAGEWPESSPELEIEHGERNGGHHLARRRLPRRSAPAGGLGVVGIDVDVEVSGCRG